MSEQNSVNDLEIKSKIIKLKELISESLGLSSVKLSDLENELTLFQESLDSKTTKFLDSPNQESEKLYRLYKAERALNEILQQKIIEQEKESLEMKISQKTSSMLTDFKGFFSSELAKLSRKIEQSKDSKIDDLTHSQSKSMGSIGEILAQENKTNKEERQRLQTENNEFRKELSYYKDKVENQKKELQFKNQEILSFKKIMQEQEEEEDATLAKNVAKSNEFGFTLEEEYDLLQEELGTLKGKFITLETENSNIQKQIESYRKELTDLKRILGDKNSEIKQLKRQSENLEIYSGPTKDNNHFQTEPSIISELEQKIKQYEKELEELHKELNISESNNRELNNLVKKMHDKSSDKEILNLQLEIDKLSKLVWKIEKSIGVFDTNIMSDTPTFERHVEVYGLLLGKIFNAKGYAMVVDTLMKHRGKVLTKKMVTNESKAETHVVIRVLRELHDTKIIHFDEEQDQIIWR